MTTPENFLIGQPLDQETKDKLFVVYQGTGISLDSFEILISNLIIKCTPIPDYKKLGSVANNMIVNDIHKETLYESEKVNIPVDLQEYFDPNVTINLPDNIPLNIRYEKNSYQEFKNKSFEM